MATSSVPVGSLAGESFAGAGSRESRALDLWESRGHQIEQIWADLYIVPSADGERTYRVRYGSESSAREECNCDDAVYRTNDDPQLSCKHVLAVAILRAKRRARYRARRAAL